MIHLISTAIFDIGLSSAIFLIDGTKYEYTADKQYVNVCAKMARRSNNKALNYIEKVSVSVTKIEVQI